MKTLYLHTNSSIYSTKEQLFSFKFLRLIAAIENHSYMVRYDDISFCTAKQGKNVIIALYIHRRNHKKRQKKAYKK